MLNKCALLTELNYHVFLVNDQPTQSFLHNSQKDTQIASVTGGRRKSRDKELRNTRLYIVMTHVSLSLPSPVPLLLRHMTLYDQQGSSLSSLKSVNQSRKQIISLTILQGLELVTLPLANICWAQSGL